jgi:hypothetical protein
MTPAQLQEYLKNKLIGSIDEALKHLRIAFRENKNRDDEVILLMAELEVLVYQERIQVEKTEEIRRLTNSLRQRTLSLINEIQEPETKVYNLSSLRFEKILVLSPNEIRVKDMEKLFPDSIWKSVDVKLQADSSSIKNIKTFEVIVFDNHISDKEQARANELENLESLIASSNQYILYFGIFSELVQKYPKRIYATNSIFSFHGRLQELLSFAREFPASSKS